METQPASGAGGGGGASDEVEDEESYGEAEQDPEDGAHDFHHRPEYDPGDKEQNCQPKQRFHIVSSVPLVGNQRKQHGCIGYFGIEGGERATADFADVRE